MIDKFYKKCAIFDEQKAKHNTKSSVQYVWAFGCHQMVT